MLALAFLFGQVTAYPAVAVVEAQRPSPPGASKPGKTKKGVVRGDVPCLSWIEPGVETKAVLLCVHGLGLNSGSWQAFGQKMSRQGLPTYAIDVRGFGSWMEAKGHKNVNFNACIDDVQDTLAWIHKAHADRAVFLVGESMGGAIALQCAARYPDMMSGLISACASGDRFKEKKTDLQVALHILTGPRRDFDIGKSVVNQATTNPELRQEWSLDPLNRMDLSAKDLVQFQKFMNHNHDAAQEIKTMPVLMVQGSKDGLVKPEGTEELFKELSTPNKQLMMVPNGEHLVFEQGQCSEQTLDQVAKWIFEHTPSEEKLTNSSLSPIGQLILEAREALDNQHISQAKNLLHAACKKAPKDPEAHYLLGVAHYKSHHFALAFRQLRLARKYAKGAPIAQDANAMMMSMPANIVASEIDSTMSVQTGFTKPGSREGREAVAGKPRVVVFNAKWCAPCKDMSATVTEAEKRYGTQVIFKTIDVDDPNNQALVDHFAIGPVPTTVFITSEGQVADFQIGYAGIDGLVNGLNKILPAQ